MAKTLSERRALTMKQLRWMKYNVIHDVFVHYRPCLELTCWTVTLDLDAFLCDVKSPELLPLFLLLGLKKGLIRWFSGSTIIHFFFFHHDQRLIFFSFSFSFYHSLFFFDFSSFFILFFFTTHTLSLFFNIISQRLQSHSP